jgi:Zn-dependent protease with chaperone function
MTQEEFEGLVRQHEQESRANERAYLRRVVLFALLGYAYVVGVLVVLLAIIGGLIWIVAVTRSGSLLIVKLGLPAGVVGFTIVKGMWVRIEPPTGIALARGQAPKLFAEVDRIARTLQAPRPGRILVTHDFNAFVSQLPRLGVFGWHQNYLVLGVPLMVALTPAQFRAIIAHELGHLSRAHGRIGVWLHRVRMTWIQIMQEFEKQGRSSGLFQKFLGWYAPRFSAYAFVLDRAQEYEADRQAAAVAGRDQSARALARVEVMGRHLDQRFWPSLWSGVRETRDAPHDVYSRLHESLQQPPSIEDVTVWLADARSARTGLADTHPSLSDRLAALTMEMEPEMACTISTPRSTPTSITSVTALLS